MSRRPGGRARFIANGVSDCLLSDLTCDVTHGPLLINPRSATSSLAYRKGPRRRSLFGDIGLISYSGLNTLDTSALCSALAP